MGLYSGMHERPDRTSFIDAILQCPPAEFLGCFVWMVAKFPKQNLGQIFTALAPGQDHKC
jgi:hypothetical protein